MGRRLEQQVEVEKKKKAEQECFEMEQIEQELVN